MLWICFISFVVIYASLRTVQFLIYAAPWIFLSEVVLDINLTLPNPGKRIYIDMIIKSRKRFHSGRYALIQFMHRRSFPGRSILLTYDLIDIRTVPKAALNLWNQISFSAIYVHITHLSIHGPHITFANLKGSFKITNTTISLKHWKVSTLFSSAIMGFWNAFLVPHTVSGAWHWCGIEYNGDKLP